MQGRETGRFRYWNGRERRIFAGLMAALLALPLLAAVVAKPSQAAPTIPKSVPLTHLEYGFTMALLENNVPVRDMGYDWVMYTLSWADSEPTQGVYDWGHADNIVNYARNAGINVAIRVSRSPVWARDPRCAENDTCPPQNPDAFGVFMGALATHVRPLIGSYQVAYEIWNEPNTSNEWGGDSMCPEPEKYADMVRAAYPRIKAAHPAAPVIAGAVTTVGQERDKLHRPAACALDDIAFLRRMYAAGARPYFDILSSHPYGFVSAPEADPVTSPSALVFRRAERHRDLMVQNGDAAKQMWATELGWAIDPPTTGSSCGRPDWYFIFNPQQQADYLVRAHQWARSYWPWMGAMFVFNFDFSDAPWYPECHPFRFWAVKGRPAQAALASFAQSPPATYTPIASPQATSTATPFSDDPPVINAVRYNPPAFNRDGGTLTIDVDASDDPTGIESANAIVTYPGGATQLLVFSLVSGTNRSGTWRVTFNISPNNGTGVQTYTFQPYVVEDSASRRTTNAPAQQITVTDTRFTDVPTDFWAYTFIEYLANAGIISGYADNTFRPNNNATRGQFSKMIVLGEGWPIDTGGGPHFTDVLPGSTFYDYVETAANHSVINGYADGTFRPNNNITRGQIAKIIVLAEGWPFTPPPNPTFSDVLPGSAFYQYVETAVAHGIVSGYADGTFRPNNNATRAQLSKMLYLAITGEAPTSTATATVTVTVSATNSPTNTPSATTVANDTETATGTPTATMVTKDTPTSTATATAGSKP